MHWRTKEGLLILKSMVEKFGSVRFSPSMIESKFTMEMDWYKQGRPLLKAFKTEGIIEERRNDKGIVATYLINLKRMEEEGIEIEGFLLQIYRDTIRDEGEKTEHEVKHEVAKITNAEPEVRR